MRFAKPGMLLASVLAVIGCSARDIPADTGDGCARCHGDPPATAAHAQLVDPTPATCSACHGTTVAADGTIIPGGTHQNGRVDTGHPAGYAAPAMHGPAADASIFECASCHGTDYAGNATLGAPSCNDCHAGSGFADWQTNCTFCHGTRTAGYTGVDAKAAPPQGVHGETLTSEPPVGAHQKHLGVGSTISDGVACDDCHTVPSGLGHLDGSVDLSFSAFAGGAAAYAAGACSSVYCHGATLQGGTATTPTWTGSLSCDGCHGLPPPTGKVPTGGTQPLHVFHAVGQGVQCFACHDSVATNSLVPPYVVNGVKGDATARSLHVNGAKDVSFAAGGTWNASDGTCTSLSCHGNQFWRQ